MKRIKSFLPLIAGGILSIYANAAFANTGGTALPWEGPLRTIRDSLKGDVAYSIAVIALIICGATLVFGEELSGIVRKFAYVVIAMSIMLLSQNFISAVFNISGAVM
jgi:type IV secretion system protein TrbC